NNLDRLHEIENADNEFIREIITVFINNVPANAIKLVEACNNKEWERVYFIAHKMKVNIDLLNMESIKTDIHIVEQNAKSKTNLEQLAGKVTHINKIVLRSQKQMKEDFDL